MTENIKCKFDVLYPIETIKTHEKNPNQHSNEQIERLAKIIEYQGVRLPIIVSKLSDKIVSGHGRLMALKSLGYTKVPVVFQDFENEQMEYLFLVSDNAIQMDFAELNISQIKEDLIDFNIEDIDLLGFKDFSINMETHAIDINEIDSFKFVFKINSTKIEELMHIQKFFKTDKIEIDYNEKYFNC